MRGRPIIILSLAATVSMPLFAASALAPRSGPPEDAPEKAADSQDRIICKRFPVTGSLVDSYRSCKTKREWEHERTNINAPSTIAACNKGGGGGIC